MEGLRAEVASLKAERLPVGEGEGAKGKGAMTQRQVEKQLRQLVAENEASGCVG